MTNKFVDQQAAEIADLRLLLLAAGRDIAVSREMFEEMDRRYDAEVVVNERLQGELKDTKEALVMWMNLADEWRHRHEKAQAELDDIGAFLGPDGGVDLAFARLSKTVLEQTKVARDEWREQVASLQLQLRAAEEKLAFWERTPVDDIRTVFYACVETPLYAGETAVQVWLDMMAAWEKLTAARQ